MNAPARCFLGLDLGTSELKALLLGDDHQVIATAHAPLSVQRPQPLWSEQDPQAWWQALQQVMAELQASHAEALARLHQAHAHGTGGVVAGATSDGGVWG